MTNDLNDPMKNMKSFIVFFIPALTCFIHIQAQNKNTIEGIYSLQGVMETASGFKLNMDSTFEFYFSYGALDRYGSGTWRKKNDSIIFSSKPFPGSDFKITDSGFTENKYTTLTIKDANPSFYRFVHCLFTMPNGDTLLDADEDGVIILPGRPDTVRLLSELSPERVSTFSIKNPGYNFYAFAFEPWTAEVFFERFALHYTGGNLEGIHPLLGKRKYIFVKEEE